MTTHYFIRTCLLVAALGIVQGSPSRASEAPGSTPGAVRDKGVRDVAPGRVTLRMSETGRLMGFGVSDAGGDNWLVERGGIVLFARDEDRTVELLNTMRSDATVLARTQGLAKVKEGAVGGTRFPSSKPDDDGDGSIDEDRLDGIDNDNDGRTDEDFAAVGDEMIVTAYQRTIDDNTSIEIYQECFAWSLHHIDGMVAMRLVVTNTGKRDLESVRIGNVFDVLDGQVMRPLSLGDTRRDEWQNAGDRLRANGMIIGGSKSSFAAMLFAPSDRKSNPSWINGVAGAEGDLEAIVADFARKQPEDGAGTNPGESQKGSLAYMISPDLGTLRPGRSLIIFVALLDASKGGEETDRAIDYTYRTVIGDGTHRVIPPPMEMKRRIVWGTYGVTDAGGADPRFGIMLNEAEDSGVDPEEITSLGNLDVGSARSFETPSGNLRLEWPGELPSEMDRPNQRRIHMRGRLRNGEMFDAILEPAAIGRPGLTAHDYFESPGKIDETLLSGSPNPFREQTTIFYEVPSVVTDESGNELQFVGSIGASIKIYNVAGRLIATLADGVHTPGRYSETWNATNDAGRAVASGVYYVKLQLGQRHVTKRLLQLK